MYSTLCFTHLFLLDHITCQYGHSLTKVPSLSTGHPRLFLTSFCPEVTCAPGFHKDTLVLWAKGSTASLQTVPVTKATSASTPCSSPLRAAAPGGHKQRHKSELHKSELQLSTASPTRENTWLASQGRGLLPYCN